MIYGNVDIDETIFTRLAGEAERRGVRFEDYAREVLFGAIGEYARSHPSDEAGPAEG